jgi:hypothetical protein
MQARRTLKRSALALAITLAASSPLYAQSNSQGYIFGQVSGGGSVLVENVGTGQKREIAVDADGNFRASALPTGRYRVTHNGVTREVTVNLGGGTNVTFENAEQLETIDVIGTVNPIDLSSVESTTILTAEQVEKIPVPRTITNVALLAPGTVRGDAAFGNLASFGGASVAENAFFVNGFNITNSFNNLNFGQVPFQAIAEQQVKTGGYGAEFGRATGGVVNLVTRRGSNEFEAGGSVFYSPESLNGTTPDVYSLDGDLIANNSRDANGDAMTAALWASGALVQDRLFAYALVEYGQVSDGATFNPVGVAFNTEDNNESPTWLTKFDWTISDNHLLELTAFSDTNEFENDVYAAEGDGTVRGAFKGTAYNETGGESWSMKYTGYLSDNFTLSALYGHGESSRANYGIAANGIRQEYAGNVGGNVSGCPVITDIRTGVNTGQVPAITGCNFIGVLGSTEALDERDQFRIDAEWVLGDHLLRFGIDMDQFDSFDARTFEGGAAWQYRNPLTSGPLAGQNRVRKRVFQTGAGVAVDSEAFYIEDRWQLTDNLMVYGGLRWDSFENKNGDGQTFVKIDNQFGPRLGFAWDAMGDGSLKVFGNAGRYALPLTATVAVRGASRSLFSEEFYTYTGIDPVTGAPTGLTRVPNPNCGGCDTRYLNNEFGVGKDPRGIASENLEPMYQDEYIAGMQMQFTEALSGGVRGIYRDLKRAIDDQCDYRPILEYAIDNDLEFNPYNPGFAFCHLYNPGSDGIFNVDVDGNGTFEQITIAADVLGPKAKRRYTALELFSEGSWDNLFLQGSWTIAHSYGNTEGGVKSDIGQADTGTTQDFDYPELAIGSYGDLPNDRRHSFKLFGNYQLNDEWSIGGNVLVQSGRPINCFGFLGGANTSHYGNSYFSCDSGEPETTDDGAGDNGTTIVPRGSVGRTDWMRQLDLSVAYRPAFADGKLVFKADVFNVFDADAVTQVQEIGEDASGRPLFDSTYRTATAFQQARQVRFGVQYDF